MPHSNDRTVVTCAGDSEVRIFDLEYSGAAQTNTSESTRSRRFNDFFTSCRWLTEANTNARVYRSHADRAKRIVTESSPHLFLTCSEDGEVRQWDLRQPSSAYPAPRDDRRYGARRPPPTDTSDDVPPPLISYKNYGIDLNTITCSKSQPHYIALGGAHLHCFLHDRRMLGRNIDVEKGRPTTSKVRAGSHADDSMREATKCVRRFAPNNRRRVRSRERGHITACKISDARPNELISSWSGDHIYSFDIVKSPDARDEERKQDSLFRTARLANRAERKRKRTKGTISSTSLGDDAKDGHKMRRVADTQAETGQTAIRVQYPDGDSEEITMTETDAESPANLLAAHDSLLSEAQKQSERLARALVDLRKTLFDFSSVLHSHDPEPSRAATDLTQHTSSYTEVLGRASTLLPEMEDVMRNWTYPNTVDEDEIMLQNTLRRNRQSSWRFVQAAGSLASTLGGKLQTTSSVDDARTQNFAIVRPAPLEGVRVDNGSRFCYDFVKAISLWLQGGKQAILDGFRRPSQLSSESGRFPFDGSTTLSNLSTTLRDYLLPLASEEKPIVDLGKNKFERDELRRLFEDQKAAVQAFTRALDQIEELRVHQGTSDIIQETSDGVTRRIMDKGAAARFWGEKVGRALLMEAAEGVTFNFVNRAFGGLKVHIMADDEAIDDLLEAATASEDRVDTEQSGEAGRVTTSSSALPHVTIEDAEDEDNQETMNLLEQDDEEEEDENVNDEPADDHSTSESDSESAGEEDPLQQIFARRRGRLGGGRMASHRASVNNTVPYTSHTKVYKGHCNTRTVKDVNYYGLDDEYVMSGSDDGHFFIWDRKTTEIVSVLVGDGEVVNVIQGHPYEPMIACSGIDSSVKIFAPGGDSRDRYLARQGIDIANPGGARHSSLGLGRMRRRRRHVDDVTDSNSDDDNDNEEGEDKDKQSKKAVEDGEGVAPGGLKSRRVSMDRVYQITSQNNAERHRSEGDAFMTVSEMDDFLLRAWILSNAMVT